MSKFEDGSYGSMSGIALIGKVLAGRCTMNYTKASVGSGDTGRFDSEVDEGACRICDGCANRIYLQSG